MYQRKWTDFIDKKKTTRFFELVAKLGGDPAWKDVSDVPHEFMCKMNIEKHIDCQRCKVTAGFPSPDINPYTVSNCRRFTAAFAGAQNIQNRFISLHHDLLHMDSEVRKFS